MHILFACDICKFITKNSQTKLAHIYDTSNVTSCLCNFDNMYIHIFTVCMCMYIIVYDTFDKTAYYP